MLLNRIISTLLLGVIAQNSAFAAVIDCPKTITVNESVSSVQREWQPFVENSPHYFSGVTIYSGHPRERASLVPEEKSKGKNTYVARWQFTPSEKERIWISCHYLGTHATYTMELPAKTAYCEVKYKTFANSGVMEVLEVRCE